MSSVRTFDVASIQQRYNAGEELNFIFFWGNTSDKEEIGHECLSQFYSLPGKEFLFTDEIPGLGNVKFRTAEHYMMFQKARLFKDFPQAGKILECEHPHDAKKLGRGVKNFNFEIWKNNRYKIVHKGNLRKFTQNKELGDYLRSTRDHVLVEASPFDNIWGIGAARDWIGVNNPCNWEGLNLLGEALMDVRNSLITNLAEL